MKCYCTITEGKVAQGDLVFILHNTKPEKSGWWRKVRQGETDDKTVLYVLEKPIHKDFDLSLPSIKRTHIESGFCVMNTNTVKCGIEDDKYTILIDSRGIAQAFITANDYLLTEEGLEGWMNSFEKFQKDFKITKAGEEYLALLYKQKSSTCRKATKIESLVFDTI
jgi:hypothetical protein